MFKTIAKARQQLRNDGHIDLGWFFFHPRRYGIATLMRIGFKMADGRKIMLHHFWPHVGTEFHDHPWAFRTIVLWGGYVDISLGVGGQERYDILTPGSRRYRPALHAHKTSCSTHTWTLVFSQPKERQWCMGTPEEWVCGGEVKDFDSCRGMVKV